MTKQTVRNDVLQQLKDMDESLYHQRSETLVTRLKAEKAYQDAEVIGVTISRYPEVNTKPLIEAAWKAGKKVAIPKCLPTTKEMDFRIFTSYKELETVYQDLLEPIVEETTAVLKEEIDLLIVPGVVYSKAGYRIGFGGGYYDRFMTNYVGRTISLAFNEQLNENVFRESHDIPVQTIITDKEVIDCQRK